MRRINLVAIAAALTVGIATTATAQQSAQMDSTHTHTTQARRHRRNPLAAQAKISEKTARATALAKVPGGKVQAEELEREGGKLIYSYEIKVAGKPGIDEVNVNAMDGSVVGNVQHEGPSTEAKEGKEAGEAGKAKEAGEDAENHAAHATTHKKTRPVAKDTSASSKP